MKGIRALINAIQRNYDKLCCIVSNTSEANTLLGAVATELTLQQVLLSIQDGQDFESKVVVDDNGDGTTYIEIRIWNADTQTWEAPLYYLPGSNVGLPAGSLTAPINYINNGSILSQIYIELLAQGTTLDDIETNTDDVSTETTLAALLLAFNNEDFSTETTLAALLLAFNNEDFSTETTLNSLLTSFNAEDFATELTLSGIKTQIDLLNFISTALEVTVTSSVLPTGAATETTLLATNSLLTIMDAVLDSILTDTNAMVVDLAAIEILITNTNALLTTIDGVLDAIKLDTANLDVALSTRATEATQLLVNANLDLLNSKFNTLGQKVSAASHPVVLSTEQEAILEAIKLAVQNLDMDVDGLATEVTLAALLLAFNNEDFATQTTLAALLAAFNAEDFATETTLAALNLAFGNEDFATQTTLAALLLAFNNEDFSTETTLASLLLAFNNEDFATETTLLLTNGLLTTIDAVLDAIKLDTANLDVTLSSRLNTLGRKPETGSAPVVLSDEDFASLEAIRVAVEALNLDADGLATEVTLAALLLAFNTEDFATETTLALLAATDFATDTTLSALLAAFNAEDFATEVTLQALLTAFNAEGFATETTLAAVLLALNGLATEATLASVLVDTTSIDTRLTPQARQHFVLTAIAVGSIPGSLCGSVFNAGNADGIWAGMTIPPGVTITWSPIGNRDTYPIFFFNGVNTSLIIEYTI